MKKSNNKALIIVLIVIAVLAISGSVFAYISLATDIMRTEQELFAKYLMQNYEEILQIVDFNKVENLKEKIDNNKYEGNISISYTKEGATLAEGIATIDMQKDPINKKEYGIISLETQEPDETLKLEYMYGEDMYSLRFTNAVLQFLSFKNSNLKELATKLEISEETVENLPDKIDFEKLSIEDLKFTKEEINAELSKYVNMIYNNIPKEKYTKNKNTVITVNGKTITTNAYILTLDMQDIKNLTIKLLENLKQDEIILSKLQLLDEKINEYYKEEREKTLKEAFAENIQESIEELRANEIEQDTNIFITVYEENKNAIRIKLEEGLEYITLDTTEKENKKQIDINYTNIDSNNTQLSNLITLIRENENDLVINLNSVDGEEQSNGQICISLIENENNAKLNIVLEDEEGKTEIIANIDFPEEIEYMVKLDNTNNIVINDLSKEKMVTIFTLVGQKVEKEYLEVFKVEHLAPFKMFLSMIDINIPNIIQKSDLTEAEIEATNSKFTIYEEDEVSAENVNELLNIVFLHNQNEASNLTERYVLVSGDVKMNSNDTTAAKVDGNKTYKVECKKNEKGLIDEIVVTEQTEEIENTENDDLIENDDPIENIQTTN